MTREAGEGFEMMDSQLSSQMCLLNISSSAMRWLLTRNSDNSVDLDNVDQSVAFRAKRGDVFVGGAMLIVPQFENDRFVLGSVSWKRDISMFRSAREGRKGKRESERIYACCRGKLKLGGRK